MFSTSSALCVKVYHGKPLTTPAFVLCDIFSFVEQGLVE